MDVEAVMYRGSEVRAMNVQFVGVFRKSII